MRSNLLFSLTGVLCAGSALVFFYYDAKSGGYPNQNDVASRQSDPHEESRDSTFRSSPVSDQESQPANQHAQTKSSFFSEAAKLAETDVQSAIKLIKKNAPPERWNELIGILGLKICKQHPNTISTFLSSIGSREEKNHLSQVLGASLARLDVLGLSEIAESQFDGEFRNLFSEAVVAEFTRNGNYSKASEMLLKLPYSSARESSVSRLFTAWGKADLSAAVNFAKGLELPAERRSAISTLLPSLLARDGSEALVAFTSVTGDPEVAKMAVVLVSNQFGVNGDTTGFNNWLKSLPNEMRASAESSFLRSADRLSIPEITSRALEISDAGMRDTALRGAMQRLLSDFPESAGSWLTGLPEGVQVSLAAQLATQWYDIDSIKLSEWVFSLKLGKTRDAALQILALRLKDSDMEAARQVIGAISEESLRKRMKTDLNVK